MQMHSVETSAGTAICWAPSRIAWTMGLPLSRLRLMFSISTVASSTRMPTASASPPSVMMLMVSPSRLSTMIDVRIESGIETAMISVLRQLPRKSRIISRRQTGGDHRLADHAAHGRPHEDRLVGQRLDVELLAAASGSRAAACCADAAHDVQGGRAPGLQNGDERAAAAVQAHDVRLGREAVAHVGDVAQVDRSSCRPP